MEIQSPTDQLCVIISTSDSLIEFKNARVEFSEKMPTNECSLKRGRGGNHLPVSLTGALFLCLEVFLVGPPHIFRTKKENSLQLTKERISWTSSNGWLEVVFFMAR